MLKLVTLLRQLLRGKTGGDDQLVGAVDLSDSAYCFDLLGKHGGMAANCQAAPKCE